MKLLLLSHEVLYLCIQFYKTEVNRGRGGDGGDMTFIEVMVMMIMVVETYGKRL